MKNIITSILSAAIAVVIGGIVVQFGWNNFITQISIIPPITLPIAIGIDLTVTYISGYSTPSSVEKVYESYEGVTRTLTILALGVYKSVVTLLIMYIVTLFM